MGALLDQPAMLEEQDAVRPPDGRETVRDIHRGLAPGQRSQPLEEVILRLRVQRGRWLIQQEDARVAHEGAGQRHLLPFAAGEVDASIEPFAECGVVAFRQAGDEGVGSGLLAGSDHGLAVGDLIQVPQPDVLRSGGLVRDIVLEHAADLRP